MKLNTVKSDCLITHHDSPEVGVGSLQLQNTYQTMLGYCETRIYALANYAALRMQQTL